jgi:hypothetical protein
MRQIILGLIGVVWGAFILISHFAGDDRHVGGAYGAGANAAVVFGFVILAVGAVTLVKVARARQSS